MRAVDPILATEPDVHLLTSISPLPTEWIDDAFTHGLTFSGGVECAIPGGWARCQTNPAAEKTSDGFTGDLGFKPFMAYYMLECDGGYMSPMSEARNARIARSTFDVIKHQIVAGQLWWGQVEATETNVNGVLVNASLHDVATVLGGTVAVADPISIIARLVTARRKLSGSGTQLVHGPLVLVPYLIAQGLIKRVGGRYEGPGFIYVTDEGYPDDAGAPGGVKAGPLVNPAVPGTYYADVAGEAWLYVSGAVEYAWGSYVGKETLGAPSDNDGRYSTYTSWDGRTNRTSILIEQSAFLRFDTCHILAAKCYIPTITQGEGV